MKGHSAMINEKLRAARLARGWKATQIAGYMEVDRSCYNSWERGQRPSRRNICKLCAWLKKTPEELGF